MSSPAHLRPQDLVLAIGMATLDEVPSVRQLQGLSHASSPSRIHDALARLRGAGLVGRASGRVLKRALFIILRDAIRWMVPGEVGEETRGVPTAHSFGPLGDELVWSQAFVWPARVGFEGTMVGRSVQPLHPWAYGLASHLPAAHELFALTDSIRVGRARDQQLAKAHLAERLNR